MAQMEQPENEQVENTQAERFEAEQQESVATARMEGLDGDDSAGDGVEKRPDVDLSRASAPEEGNEGADPPEGDGDKSGDAAEIDLSKERNDIDLGKERVEAQQPADTPGVNPVGAERSYASTLENDGPPTRLDEASADLKKQFSEAAQDKPTDTGDIPPIDDGDDEPRPVPTFRI